MCSRICSNRFPLLTILIAVLTALSSSAGPEPRPESPSPFAVEVHGEGRPVLLIPGLGSPGSVWDAAVEALVAEGYQPHVFTLAGFAGQPALPLDGETDFLTLQRDALAEYAQGLNEPPAVVGHSLGGTLALWLAASYPQRFGPVVAVDGVAFLPALMNPGATEESARNMANQTKTMLGGMNREAYEAQTTFALSTMITAPEAARRMADASRGTDPKTAAAAMHALMSRDLRPTLSTIEVPVLLLAAGAGGEAEDLLERYGNQIAAVPAGRVEVVEGARHFIMLDQPARFLALLREHLAKSSEASSEERIAR